MCEVHGVKKTVTTPLHTQSDEMVDGLIEPWRNAYEK